MDPITLTGVGIVALFFLMGGSSGNGGGNDNDNDDDNDNDNDNDNDDNDNDNGKLNCAPGLVRDTDGRCKKAGGKTKPGQKTDPSKISKKRPDKIDRDDAWIGPDCSDLMKGSKWWRETMAPAILEYTDAGYGYPAQFGELASGAFLVNDFAAMASAGPVPMLAGLIQSYSPPCSDAILEALDLLPSQGAYEAWAADFLAIREAWSASYQMQNPNDPEDYSGWYDPDLEAAMDQARESSPLLPYIDAVSAIENGDIQGFGPKIQALVSAMAKVALMRAQQGWWSDQGGDYFASGGAEKLDELPPGYELDVEFFA